MNDPNTDKAGNASNADNRLFGLLAIILLCMALLVPWVIAAFSSRPEPAVGFGVVSMYLGIIFGSIGWRHKTGKVTVLITGALLGIALIMALVFYPLRRAQYEKETEKIEKIKQRWMQAELGAVRAAHQQKSSPTNEP